LSINPKIAKTMVSFANHKGGRLLIGVRDDKTIVGIKTEEEKYMLDLAANFYCKPPVELIIKEWNVNGKIVLEALIPEGKEKPYYSKGEDEKWWVYIRVKDQSLLASKVTVDVLKRSAEEQSAAISFSSKEEALFNYLKQNERITLKQFSKLINVSRWRATKILVNLISVGVIREHTFEQTPFYTLS
jgi:predicted HTH transcriptional regulator